MSHKVILLLVYSISLLLPLDGLACQCVPGGGDFLQNAPKTDLVFVGKVKKYLSFKEKNGLSFYEKIINFFSYENNKYSFPLAMEIEVKGIYLGHEINTSIIIWGSNGAQCRPYTSEFALDKEYVFAVTKNSTQKNIIEKVGDYVIHRCGEFWLDIDATTKTVKGEKTKSTDLESLKRQLLSISAS